MTLAEYHATKIKAAIAEARAAGVNVTLDFDQDFYTDNVEKVWLQTSVHQRQPGGYMKIVDGPYIVEEA